MAFFIQSKFQNFFIHKIKLQFSQFSNEKQLYNESYQSILRYNTFLKKQIRAIISKYKIAAFANMKWNSDLG